MARHYASKNAQAGSSDHWDTFHQMELMVDAGWAAWVGPRDRDPNSIGQIRIAFSGYDRLYTR